MKHRTRDTIALAGVLALAASPALAQAPGGHGHQGKAKGKSKPHTVMYVFKGTWNAGDGTVTVTGGNAHVRKGGYVGEPVLFDLSAATLVVADTSGDSALTVGDLQDHDKVVVKARLPRKNPGDPPSIKARQLVDQTHPPAPAPGTPEQD